MTEAQLRFRDEFEDLSTEDKLNTTLSYIMNLETVTYQQGEKIEVLEKENKIQLSIIQILVQDTKWYDEQLGANGKPPEITEPINADILSTIEVLENKSAWTKAETIFYMKINAKKFQRMKAKGDIRTKFDGKSEVVFRDDILDKSNLQ